MLNFIVYILFSSEYLINISSKIKTNDGKWEATAPSLKTEKGNTPYIIIFNIPVYIFYNPNTTRLNYD